mmetsp:Transcript_34875/g.58305  ORF Transcript_34875/g.58305 Transcript_34875/m.58305 type:complete len:222 (-) Transcript_34875:989-1654(-)
MNLPCSSVRVGQPRLAPAWMDAAVPFRCCGPNRFALPRCFARSASRSSGVCPFCGILPPKLSLTLMNSVTASCCGIVAWNAFRRVSTADSVSCWWLSYHPRVVSWAMNQSRRGADCPQSSMPFETEMSSSSDRTWWYRSWSMRLSERALLFFDDFWNTSLYRIRSCQGLPLSASLTPAIGSSWPDTFVFTLCPSCCSSVAIARVACSESPLCATAAMSPPF